MTSTPAKRIMITGANSGIGKELARQLALGDQYAQILLACRDQAKGDAAKAELELSTGRSVFHVIRMDLSSLASVRTVLKGVDEPLDAVVMNAGGTGGATPTALTADGVTEIFASNVLGHAVFLETLIAKGLLGGVGMFVGSEAARGVPKLMIPRPVFATSSVEEFASVIDGTFFAARRYNGMLAYGQVKYLGALWIAATARKHPRLRLITVSPGNTAGTQALRDQPAPVRSIANHIVMPYVAPLLGIGQKLPAGAKRLLDAIDDLALVSGNFYASAAKKITGPLIDQAEIIPDFRDIAIQEHADQAIHRYIPEPR
jgi:NAD(P)-dependent dehydrogenase (short-subunit alcohol dehydrogenase family)